MELHISKSAKRLPALRQEEFEALKENIRENGLLTPIVVDGENGEILVEGRHRYQAWVELGYNPDEIPKVTLSELSQRMGRELSHDDVTDIYNLHRRDLSASQKAMCAVEIAFASQEGENE